MLSYKLLHKVSQKFPKFHKEKYEFALGELKRQAVKKFEKGELTILEFEYYKIGIYLPYGSQV